MLTAYIGSYAPNGGGIHGVHIEAGSPPLLAGEAWIADGDSPSWLTVNAAGTHLYAVHELHRAPGNAEGRGEGRLSSYDLSSGRPRLLGRTGSGGVRPVHLGLHPEGRHAFVAHYDSGDVCVLAIDDDGCLGPVLDRRALADACGPQARPGAAQAEQAPPGSFACSGHEASHAHMALPAPGGRFVLCTDLGLDRLVVFRFDAGRGRLLEPRVMPTSPGAGPRHLVFHPQNPSRVYLLSEEASTLAWLRFDDGALQPLGETSSLPAGFAGTAYASDLRCSPDGHHLYALNRLHDSIAHFSLAPDGTPTLRDTHWCRGSYPRTLALLPGGRGLVVCNQRSDHLAWFALDGDGVPRFTGRWTGVGGAASVVFG
ncbi:lactonase family protein [Aquabacterium humicola]|uniref:lactonase family protein n=1 Tax=Aquabacterium humicola TaxID=3237377 RepID=UPI0025427647|nr:lactonase family protein [Rubrivivax pictus]